MDHDWLTTLAGWAVATLGIGGAGLAVRSRMSRDSTQRRKDRVESEFVGLLLKERDGAREEARLAREERQRELDRLKDERKRDAELVARLRADNAHQEAEIQRLIREMDSFRRRVARMFPETREFVQTNVADLSPPETKGKP